MMIKKIFTEIKIEQVHICNANFRGGRTSIICVTYPIQNTLEKVKEEN